MLLQRYKDEKCPKGLLNVEVPYTLQKYPWQNWPIWNTGCNTKEVVAVTLSCMIQSETIQRFYIIQTHSETVNQCGIGWADTEGAGERKVRSWSWRPCNSTWLLPPLGGGVEPAGVGDARPQDPGAGATTRRKAVVGGEVRVTTSTLISSSASPQQGDRGA